MANTYKYRGKEYTIDPQAQSLPEGHADIMTCSECGGPGFFRKASEKKAAHFVHHYACKFMFPDCSKLSSINFSKKDKGIIYEGNQETFDNYLNKRSNAELIELIKLLKTGPIADFYERKAELVEGYKEKEKEIKKKNHEISEHVGRISELTSDVQHYMEVIEEESKNKEKIKKYFDRYNAKFSVQINSKENNSYVIKDMSAGEIIDNIEELY